MSNRLLLISVIALGLTSNTVGQPSADKDTLFSHPSVGLSFYSNYLTFRGGLGVTYWYNPNLQSRLFIDGSYRFSSYPTYTVGINAQLNRHFKITERLSPYFGLIAKYGIEHSYYYISDYSAGDDWYLSGGVLFGAEYFLNEVFSIAGEQYLLFQYTESYTIMRHLDLTTSYLIVSFYF